MSEGEIMIQSLVQEVSIQLNKISIYGTDEFIRKRYINLGTIHIDVNGPIWKTDSNIQEMQKY